MNIYDSPEFYEYVRETFLELDNDYYNLALNLVMDTMNYKSVNNPKAREKILEFMDDLHLLDYFRILNPDKRAYTWRKKNPFKIRAFRLYFDI